MDYINYYILQQNEKGTLYLNEASKELRETLKENIKWDGSFPNKYKVPFLGDTNLSIVIEYDSYCVALTKNINNKDRILLMTIGCFNEKPIPKINGMIQSYMESENINLNFAFKPVLPFVVDIPVFTQEIIQETAEIMSWAENFSKTLALTIIGERNKIQDKLNETELTYFSQDNTFRKSVAGLPGVRKDNYDGLPENLKEFNYYFQECGHSIMAIPKCLLKNAIHCNALDDFEIPIPVKYVLEKGYKMYKGHVVCDVKVDVVRGITFAQGYEEF